MYGFSAALAQLKLELHVWRSPLSPFIVQLPLDSELGNAHAFHYTQWWVLGYGVGQDGVGNVLPAAKLLSGLSGQRHGPPVPPYCATLKPPNLPC